MKIYSVDKIDEGIATVVCDDGGVFNIPAEILSGMTERDVFSAVEVNGNFAEITPMPEEKERRIKKARSLLDKFKNKKQN